MHEQTEVAAEFLNRLEALESRLLAWGLVDGSFDETELESHAERFLQEHKRSDLFDDPFELIDSLLDRRLLTSWIEGVRTRYRTRMGESIRLLARLRQLFPRHRDGHEWQRAKTLVADFRFILRPRVFPRRDVPHTAAIAEIHSAYTLGQVQRDVFASMMDRRGERSLELAKFQVRSTLRILMRTDDRSASGSIVCAGTGSGKTLAFYLPTFLHFAQTLDHTRWTRCVALYPRKELLKDQLSETYRQARRIDRALKQHGRRKLVIGALFGDTPHNPAAFDWPPPPSGWQKTVEGYACSFLRCPNERCTGDMIWKNADRESGRERLVCDKCAAATEADELVLTRERLLAEPADILFTTTEMLNQRLTDSRFGRLFGVGTPPDRKPALVLLDEVHTYSGRTGAQVGLLLRRWKHAAQIRPHFVGLSATLTDARRFFAQLVGVEDHRVEDVSPFPNEVIRSGAEYLLAIRGDPASGASLLSTTIQTAMLMRRVQDGSVCPCSDGLYGTREFVFTDDLDVTNRLYFNLLDAEGLDSWGHIDRNKSGGSLANLRSTELPEQGLRRRFGQVWKLCEEIGHSLRGNAVLRIGRTSSQDAGVATGADIIVATASLEVGFNDPEVNVVLQHKAPRDPAQFLQRKGRAGRRTEMRPWTVVVLSDYGRDRLTWQSYDLLFAPDLPARDLPVSNRHVLRMQSVFAFMDWIAAQLRRDSSVPPGSVWRDFDSPPQVATPGQRDQIQRRQHAEARIIEDLLTRDDRHDELAKYLGQSLDQNETAVASVMWEPPRALMTAVLPTLLRRLKSGWNRADHPGEGDTGRYDYFVANNPLPEFVPANLFSDLNLPEVRIVTPAQQQNDTPREDSLPILQAMKEFAPGRVSRRFGIVNRWARHWIGPPDLGRALAQQLPLCQYLARFDEQGEFQYRCLANRDVRSVRCVRPYEVHPQRPPDQVQDTSNAFLVWKTQIVPGGEGVAVDVPSPSRWEALIREVRFFTHGLRAPLEMRRFSMGSDATIKLLDGTEIETHIEFVDSAAADDGDETSAPPSVAVGYAAEVDGVVFRFAMPDGSGVRQAHPGLIRGLRSALFLDRVRGDSRLDGIANRFRRQWLAEVYVAAIVDRSLSSGQTLEETWRTRTESDFEDVLRIVFQSLPVSAGHGQPDDDSGDGPPLDEVHQKLFHDLSALLHENLVVDVLRYHAPTLWQNPDETWSDWLGEKFSTTLGAAILDAVQQLCPDLDAGDLLLDIDPGPRAAGDLAINDGLSEVWLTEQSVGGGGVIENFLVRYGSDPRRFFDLVEAALKPSDFEIADEQLTMFLDWVVSLADASVRDAVDRVRRAMDDEHAAFAEAFQKLIQMLSKKGLFVCHSVVAAMATRILKPGSQSRTDAMLHELIHDWRACEERLGIEIDSRVFASQRARDERLDDVLGDLVGDALETDRRQWRFNALTGVLWPRGGVIRSRRLSVYNPFAALPTTEYDLVRNVLPIGVEIVDMSTPRWRELADAILVRDGAVELRASSSGTRELRAAIMSMLVDPVDSGFMLLHPRVRGIERSPGFVSARVELAEALQ